MTKGDHEPAARVSPVLDRGTLEARAAFRLG
jgi:hypothetical protein